MYECLLMKENCPLREGECVFRSYKRLLGRNDCECPLKRGASLVRIDKCERRPSAQQNSLLKKVSVWFGRCLSIRLPGGICMLRKKRVCDHHKLMIPREGGCLLRMLVST